jgi:hypothetical protein
VDERILLAVVERVGNDTLAIPVGEKVDASCWYNTNEGRTETLEQGFGRLVAISVAARIRRQ